MNNKRRSNKKVRRSNNKDVTRKDSSSVNLNVENNKGEKASIENDAIVGKTVNIDKGMVIEEPKNPIENVKICSETKLNEPLENLGNGMAMEVPRLIESDSKQKVQVSGQCPSIDMVAEKNGTIKDESKPLDKVPINHGNGTAIDESPKYVDFAVAGNIEKPSSSNKKVIEKVPEIPEKLMEEKPKPIPVNIGASTSAILKDTAEVAAKPVSEPLEDLMNMKHPLERTWGFWLYTNENRKNWLENQKELTVFDTVEDYWCLYHYMKFPSQLKLGQDYAVFRQGVSPMWEDHANKNGGRWLINLDRRDVDRIWLDLVLLMIGENFNSDIICGAVVNVRGNKNKISLWTKNKDEKSNMNVGTKLKRLLQVNYKVQFLLHDANKALFEV